MTIKEKAIAYCPDDAYPFAPAILNKIVRKAFIAGWKANEESEKPMNPSEHRDPCGLRGPSGVDGDKNWYLLDQEIIDWCGKFRPSIREAIQSTAYHFADWQKEQTEKRWLEDRGGCFWDGVEEGKKAMKEQMLKEAVEGDIGMTLHDKRADLYVRSKGYLPESLGIKCNDKVRIIIVKED